ncbi:MAG: aminomethyltransferase beta-barrel domain-containing protein, partial [Pseudomonadota bacterium]
NVKDSEGSPVELWRGRDKRKEQSYFLHRLRQSHLSGTLLPLGEFTKKEVRVLAEEMGLPTASEPESQEICFLPENDYRSFLEEKMGMEIFRKGDIIDGDGHKLGDHYGSYGFTIGQRHGLGISSLRPYYVKKIIPENNQIVAGRKEELFSKHVEAESFNWISGAPPENGIKVLAQIRYRHRAAPGLLEILSSDRVRFQFDEPQWAITPGQALVCYEGDRLLGGGWIL